MKLIVWMFAFTLAALLAPRVASASGPVIVDYGEPGFMLSYDAGYMGLMDLSESRAETAAKERSGLRGVRSVAPVLRAFLSKARAAGLPIQPFEPLLDEVELRWNDEGQLAYFRSERFVGYWGREPKPAGDVAFPINVSSRHGAYLVRYTFSEELTPVQMKTYHDMLKALFADVAAGKREAAQAVDSGEVFEPIVMVEKKKYVLCAANLYKVPATHRTRYERELGELLEQLEDEVEQAIDEFEEQQEHKGVLRRVRRDVAARLKREGSGPKNLCNPYGPRWDQEGEHALARFGMSTKGLDAKVVFVLESQEERQRLRGAMGEAFFPVAKKVFDERRAALEFEEIARRPERKEPARKQGRDDPEIDEGSGEPAAGLFDSPGTKWLAIVAAAVLLVAFLLFVGRRGSRE